MNKRFTHIVLMMLCLCAFYLTTTASVVIEKKVEQIKLEIYRIDLLDGKEDQLVFLKRHNGQVEVYFPLTTSV